MGLFKKAIGLFTQSTVSKIMGILILLILVSATTLTITTVQQQQIIRQRASYSCSDNGGGCYDVTSCPSWDPVPINGTCPTEPYPAICCGPNTSPTPTPTTHPTATPTATPTARPTATPSPTDNVTLAIGLNLQDTSMPSTIPIEYKIITSQNFSELRGEYRFNKSENSQRQFAANVGPFDLIENAVYIINFFRTDNKMIGKTAFIASKGTVTVATVALVFGDLNNDKNVDIKDYNIFRDCWGQSATGNCSASDFDKNGVNDQVDYNTWLRGFATWSQEGL